MAYDFRRGRSPEAIPDAYPSIGLLVRVYGAIAFILEHPLELDACLKEQEHLFESVKSEYPMPAEMKERAERAREEIEQAFERNTLNTAPCARAGEDFSAL